MTDHQRPTTLTEAADEIHRWVAAGKRTSAPQDATHTWWRQHPLQRIPHDSSRTDTINGVGDWLEGLVPAGISAGDDRLSAVTRLLLSEVRAQSGHFGGPLERLLGERVHDQRLRGECMTCQLIAIAENALEGTDGADQ